jgi:hypothetical protein
MRIRGKLEVVDRERIVKIEGKKVRQKWCRNGAEMQRGKAREGAFAAPNYFLFFSALLRTFARFSARGAILAGDRELPFRNAGHGVPPRLGNRAVFPA